jgi:predicted RND superfamily exporter protein
LTVASGSSDENNLIQRMNIGFASLAGWCFDYRWGVATLCLLIFFGAGHLAGQIEIDASYESYFFEGDTTYQAYEAYREDFGSDEVSYIGYELPGVEHGPWNVAAMEALIHLTEALEDEVPFIYDVKSLANAELTIGTEDGIEVSKIKDDWPLTQAELLERREAYLKKPMLVGGIINEEADFGAIIIDMDLSSTDSPELIQAPEELRAVPEDPWHLENLYPQVTDGKIEEILARPEYAEHVFYHSGDVPLNAYYNRIILTEPDFLQSIMLLVISAILLFVFRNMVAVVAPALVLYLTITVTVAVMALIGFKIGLGFSKTPTLVMAIGVAHSVHILSEFTRRLRSTGDRRRSLVEAMSLVGVPCLLTSVTTAVGFASMSFVPIKSISQGAISNSIGVLLAFVFSITLLMSLLSIDWFWPFRQLRQRFNPTSESRIASSGVPTAPVAGNSASMGRILDWVSEFNFRHQTPLLVGFAIFMVFFGVGAFRVQIDSNWLDDFWDTSTMYQTIVRVDDAMGGATNIIYLFDSGREDGIKDPAVLREIERVQMDADKDEWFVRKSYSIVDIVKDLNQSFHGDDPAYYRIPDTREEVAQYLLLYESSGGEEAEEYVSSDYRHANLELRLRIGRTAWTLALADRLAAGLEADPLEASELTLTGIGALWLVLMDYIMSSNIQGLTIAFSVITLMMMGIFRSFRIGAISMIPNLAPVLLAMGTMGWLDITLDYNKVTIAAIALGISVDDTIHLMTRFHHEFGVHRDYRKALCAALNDVGRALIVTSSALVLGFLVLIFSSLRSEGLYGILLSSALVTALIADFFFMPALVLWLKPFGPEGKGRSEAAELAVREAA